VTPHRIDQGGPQQVEGPPAGRRRKRHADPIGRPTSKPNEASWFESVHTS